MVSGTVMRLSVLVPRQLARLLLSGCMSTLSQVGLAQTFCKCTLPAQSTFETVFLAGWTSSFAVVAFIKLVCGELRVERFNYYRSKLRIRSSTFAGTCCESCRLLHVASRVGTSSSLPSGSAVFHRCGTASPRSLARGV